MVTMKPEIVGYLYVDNILAGGKNLKAMGEKMFGDDFKGFVKEITFIHSDGYITKKLTPISGSPVQAFRQAIEEAGLVGFQF